MIRKLLSYLFTASLLMAASCISEEVAECPESDGKNVTLSLKLDMGLQSNASRAGNDATPPDYFEKYSGDFEKITSLRVIILRDSVEIEAAKLVKTNDEGDPIDDNLEFIVKGNETKTIILIANEDALPPPTGSGTAKDYLDQFLTKGMEVSNEQWQQLNDWKMSMPQQNATGSNAPTNGLFSTTSNTHLPLTEKFKVYVSTDRAIMTSDDRYLQEVRLFLTRAAAKATFRFYVGTEPQKYDVNTYKGDPDFKGEGLYITDVRLNSLDWTEYILPKNTTYYPAKYTTDNSGVEIPNEADNNERYITSFTPVPDVLKFDYIYHLDTPAEIRYNNSTPDTYGPIYFPESMCAVNQHYTVQVRVAAKDENDRLVYGENDGWITAKNGGFLTDNILTVKGRDAIARNTHMRILIFFEETGIKATAIVAPYNTVKLEPIFGLNPKTK